MPQFDVYRLSGGAGLVIDCQSDLLGQLNTRLVVPLMERPDAPAPAQRLNPVLTVRGKEHVMVTQFAAAVYRRELGEVIASLKDHSFEITGALDVLLSGA